MRTLNEWEQKALEEMLALSQEIIYSGFDCPHELYRKASLITSMLFNQLERYEYYSQQQSSKVITVRPEFWSER
jgi:hypothetical protein